jgi:hypothetical protein
VLDTGVLHRDRECQKEWKHWMCFNVRPALPEVS